jgi:hypothetical protein
MTDASEIQKRLEDLKREYRGARSMIEMMEKGTSREVILKMRIDKLLPLEREIQRLEGEVATLAK